MLEEEDSVKLLSKTNTTDLEATQHIEPVLRNL
jgi:hypothetical protein